MKIMTPGTYLAKRRTAAGLSLEDVAAQISTVPQLGARDRAELLGRIETDVAPITGTIANVLIGVFPFDARVLVDLISLHADPAPSVIEAPRVCRVCACSQCDPCIDQWPGATCGWDEEYLCSACWSPGGDGAEAAAQGGSSHIASALPPTGAGGRAPA